MRIGVISDTHGLLRPEAMGLLEGVDHIIHAGDIGAPEIIPRLGSIAPTTGIRGNVDVEAWALAYPERLVLELAGRSIYVLHDINQLDVDPVRSGFDVIIAGHSHRPGIETLGGILYVNPGSAGRRRFKLPITLGLMELTEYGIDAQIHNLIPSS